MGTNETCLSHQTLGMLCFHINATLILKTEQSDAGHREKRREVTQEKQGTYSLMIPSSLLICLSEEHL